MDPDPDPDADPDEDPDPAIFIIDLQDEQFFCLLLFEGTFTSFFKDKKFKRSQKTVGIKVFLLFCLMIEGSGSGSKHYESGWPKNMWIRWIGIQIRNTGVNNAYK
jgi:hypothetical protein